MTISTHVFVGILPIIIAFVLDLILGDPQSKFHPICAIGKLISLSEKLLRSIFPKTKIGERVSGIILAVIIPVFSCLVIFTILKLIFIYWGTCVYIITSGVLGYFMFAAKSLKKESLKVYKSLDKGDIKQARIYLSYIVGRDTAQLSEKEIAAACVETIAENTNDGVIAPIFYFALGGAPLCYFYKAVNTLDSMVGYKNEKYKYFGTASAKLDDIMGYVPARMSALLMTLASKLLNFNFKNAIIIYKRDKRKHQSPNSAHTEAVCAGALDIRLGGGGYYNGVFSPKPYIGDNNREISLNDIKNANALMICSAWINIILLVSIKIAFIILIKIAWGGR